MKSWFKIFRKKQIPVEIDKFCSIAIKSGYSPIGGGFLVGKLKTYEDRDYRIDLREIYTGGLHLFDTHNRLELIVSVNEQSLSVPVIVQSYEQRDSGFSVLFGISDKNIENEEYAAFNNLITRRLS